MQNAHTKKSPMSFRINPTTDKRLEDYCSKTGIPKTRVIERAVAIYIQGNYAREIGEKKRTREKRSKKVQISMRMRIDIYNNLAEYCVKTESPKTYIIEKAVNRYINTYNTQHKLLSGHYEQVKKQIEQDELEEQLLSQELLYNGDDANFK